MATPIQNTKKVVLKSLLVQPASNQFKYRSDTIWEASTPCGGDTFTTVEEYHEYLREHCDIVHIEEINSFDGKIYRQHGQVYKIVDSEGDYYYEQHWVAEVGK